LASIALLHPAPLGLDRFCGRSLAETTNDLYKTEVIRRRGPWRNIDTVELATFEWVNWLYNRRLLQPLGWLPPVEYEETF
jgi:transposase InsO family protein